VLLASSITPSGASWAEVSARASVPSAHFVELSDVDDRTSIRDLASTLSIAGAATTAVDVYAAMTSVQRTAMFVAAFESAAQVPEPTVLQIGSSVPELIADVCSMAVALEVGAPGHEMTARLSSAATAVASGEIGWLVATPPEPAAMTTVTTQIAQATALGLAIRGVLVAPMPRKSDGWPKKLRQGARERVRELADQLFGVTVLPARAGKAPQFTSVDDQRLDTSVTKNVEGDYLLSVTIPGLQSCDLEVGVWSIDPSYPSTHLVLRLDGVTARIALDPTLRRCVGVEAVVAGDTITVPFEPDPVQWPDREDDGGVAV
jgi:hypothetical protein